MDMQLKAEFAARWRKYCGATPLPVVFFYTDREDGPAVPANPNRCLVALLHRAWRGEAMRLPAEAIGCPGGKRYAGFATEPRPDFKYFLSCGIPGQMEGERYKKSPELVEQVMARSPKLEAPARFLVLEPWDALEAGDEPDAAIFLAAPDVLAGLFTLAGFEEADPESVFSPFGAGCATAFAYPYLEQRTEKPRCVLGCFDVTARPFVPKDTLTFAVPMKKLARMCADMDESFLVTRSWELVRKRIDAGDE
jgi:uncharacterized protein (DUF169 family)